MKNIFCFLSFLGISLSGVFGQNSFDPDSVVEVELHVGDPSGSHSEWWDMIVTGGPPSGPGTITHRCEDFGVPSRDTFTSFRVGHSYDVTVHWIGTHADYEASVLDPDCELEYRGQSWCGADLPDYDYIAEIDVLTDGIYVDIDDPDDLLGSSNGNTTNEADGKTASFQFYTVELELETDVACDGNLVAIDVVVDSAIVDDIASVQLSAKTPSGGTDFTGLNPHGMGLTFSQIDQEDITRWKVDLVRWYSTVANHSNDTSDYHIYATVNFVDGQAVDVGPYTLTANVSDESEMVCIDGYANTTNHFSGSETVTFDSVFNSQTGQYEAFISNHSGFYRDVQAEDGGWYGNDPNSQFYGMIQFEEVYHVIQLEDPDHPQIGTLWQKNHVLQGLGSKEPHAGPDAWFAETVLAGRFATEIQLVIEAGESALQQIPGMRCDIEREAKAYAGSSYRYSYDATYVVDGCPQ